MVVQQLERVGELLTVREAAKIEGITVDAL